MIKSPSMASSQFNSKLNKPNKLPTQSPLKNKNLLSVPSEQDAPRKQTFKEKLALNKPNNHNSALQEAVESSTSEISNLFTPLSGKSNTYRETLETKNAKNVPTSGLKTSASTLPSPREPKTLLSSKQIKPAASGIPHSKPIKGPLQPKINVDSSRILATDRDQERVLFEENEKSVRSITGEPKESSQIGTITSDNEYRRKTPQEENILKSQFFSKRGGQHEENERFEVGYRMEEEEADFEECESEEMEEIQRHYLKANKIESEEKHFLNDVEMETSPITFGKVKKITIPKFAHELSHQKVYERISFERRLSLGAISKQDNGNQTPISNKTFYYDLLKELEQTPLNIEKDAQILHIISKSDKTDQVTFAIVQKKLGYQYSQALFRIFTKYIVSGDDGKNKMNLGKLLNFVKDFNLLNKNLTKESVTLIFSNRCPSKIIDFPAFVDILFRISKKVRPLDDNKNLQFQMYLDDYILSQHQDVLEKQLSPRFGPVLAFGQEYGPENEALRILEGHDELFKHLFTLYKSIDIQYSNHSIIKVKDFKVFCQDYCIVPVLTSLNGVSEVFKKFQLNEKAVVNFRGFILCLCSIANIGFENSTPKEMFDTYSKRLTRFFEFLVKMNDTISNQLVANDILKFKN